jgi:glycosyltransferase involved in cell wall biosynthesis
MNICWALPRYPNRHPAGAELTAHELLLELRRRGHQAEAVITGSLASQYQPATFEGVPVGPVSSATFDQRYDVVLAHLGHADQARAIAGRAPVVWMAHAAYQYAWGDAARPDRYIANSEHVQAAGPHGTWLMRPHVPASRYTGAVATFRHGEMAHITLIGASDQKGIALLRRIARAQPHRSFLVVQNAYDQQRISTGQKANIHVVPPGQDMRRVYALTRILLVPSVESWGRVAIEAGHNGIPTIAHPSTGLHESAPGTAAIWADRGNLHEWTAALAALDDPTAYQSMSRMARANAAIRERDTRSDLDQVVDQLTQLTDRSTPSPR